MKVLRLFLLSLCLLSVQANAYAPFLGGSVGIISPATYRNIASAVRAPGFNGSSITDGTDTTQNGESYYFNESGQSLSAVKLIYSGWYTCPDTTCHNESAAPNAYTVTASIDYPPGTFTQVTFSSATSLTVNPGDNDLSDAITIAGGIPAGVKFGVRTFVSVSGGQKWPTSGNLWGTETGQRGVGLSDLTLGGTITGTSIVLRPSAILASTTLNKSIAILGDSIAAGAGDGSYDTHGNTGGFARGATGISPVMDIAVTGTKLSQQVLTGKLNYRLDLLTKAGITHDISDWSVNDVGAGNSAATIEANMVTLWNEFNSNGQKAVHTTLTPEASSGDGWKTTTYQNISQAGFQGGAGSVRALVNGVTRTLPVPLYDYIEIANNVEPSPDSGFWGPTSVYIATGPDSWTASGTPTTTSMASNSNKPTNWYGPGGGTVVFTSGTLNGQYVGVSANTSGGTFTLGSTKPPVTGAANNGSGLIRLALVSTKGMVTGSSLTVASVSGTAEANGTWTITVIDGTHVDLQASTFSNAYTGGGSTVGTTLTSAPALGDTFQAYTFLMGATNDGTHPNNYTINGTPYGGTSILKAATSAKISTW